jgi:F-type H+-transporting ATPase subunit delta
LKSASLQYANAFVDVALGEGTPVKTAPAKGAPKAYVKDLSAFGDATLVLDTSAAIARAKKVAAQLAEFGVAYATSAELRTFLASPAVTPEQKHAVIEKIIARLGADKIVRNFLFVIADSHRTQLLPEILATVHQVLRQRQKIAEAEICSAVELSTAQKRKLTAALADLTGKDIEPKYSLDPALLGGAVVRIGDTIYDGSLRNRLNEMRARLAAE